jgi:hypothetical protein
VIPSCRGSAVVLSVRIGQCQLKTVLSLSEVARKRVEVESTMEYHVRETSESVGSRDSAVWTASSNTGKLGILLANPSPSLLLSNQRLPNFLTCIVCNRLQNRPLGTCLTTVELVGRVHIQMHEAYPIVLQLMYFLVLDESVVNYIL